MIENRILGEKFAKDFNKKYGIITYSGALAIEIALSSMNFKKNNKVLVISEVCYSIVNVILKLNLIPIIITPQNGLYITNDDIDKVLVKEDIKCIMLVHQYGIFNSIDIKKYKLKGIKVIEDVAQAWNIGDSKYKIGKDSDIVVTSFGKTKPLSYGVGGGLFFDDISVFNYVDYYDLDSREKPLILLSYTYPLCGSIEYDNLKLVANNIVKEQRTNAKKYYNLIKNCSLFKCIEYDDKHTWHRFPIWVTDYGMYKKIVHQLKGSDLEYQLTHIIGLADLKRNKKRIKYDYQKQQKYIILLRTRNIDINKQIRILKEIVDNIVL